VRRADRYVDGTLLPTADIQLPTTLEDWHATWPNADNPYVATMSYLSRASGSCRESMTRSGPSTAIWPV